MREINTQDKRFIDGNGRDVLGTVVTADWLNAVQDELTGLVRGFGGTVTPSAPNQIYQLVRAALDQLAGKNAVINAGVGLTGGGDLSASRTISLGTPSTITASSSNGVGSNTHSHAIDKASTTVAGIVQLSSATDSSAESLAATPKAVKAAYDLAAASGSAAAGKVGLTGDETVRGVKTFAHSTEFSYRAVIRRASSGLNPYLMLVDESVDLSGTITANKSIGDILFKAGESGQTDGRMKGMVRVIVDTAKEAAIEVGVYNAANAYKMILKGFSATQNLAVGSGSDNGKGTLQVSGDTWTGGFFTSQTRWPKLQLCSSGGNQALLLESGGVAGTHCLIVRPHTDGVVSSSNIAKFMLPDMTGDQTFTVLSDFAAVKAGAGYQKLPGGLIIQWGKVSTVNESLQTVTFPVAFPAACVHAQVSAVFNGSVTGAAVLSSHVGSISRTSLTCAVSENGVVSQGIFWLAIGY